VLPWRCSFLSTEETTGINPALTEASDAIVRAAQAMAELKLVQQQLLVTRAETASIIAQARELKSSAVWPHLSDAGAPISSEPEATEAAQSRHKIANAQLHQAAQQSAALAERHHLAQNLHDEVAQTLFAASLTAKILRDAKTLPAKDQQAVEQLYHMTRTALADIHALMYELYPPLIQSPDKQT